MSVASAIFEQSADVLAIVHDDDLLLQPANVLVSGYAEELAEAKLGNRLMTTENLPTHRLHIRRRLLSAVEISDVCYLDYGTNRYRVHYIVDDATIPEVAFHCTLTKTPVTVPVTETATGIFGEGGTPIYGEGGAPIYS